MEVLLYIVLPLVAVAYLFLKKKYSYFDEKNIPHIKPTWLMGNMDGVGKTIHIVDLFRNIYNECSGKDVIAGFYSMIAPALIATDLELVKQITVKDFNYFTDRGGFINEEKEPLTGHLFAIGGDKWKFLRNKLSPAFTSGKIRLMFSTISDKGDNLVKTIVKEASLGSVDMKDFSNRFTIDVTSSCAFGMEANTLNHKNPELIEIFKNLLGGDGVNFVYFFFLGFFPKISKFLNLRMFSKKIETFFFDVVGGSIKNREANNENRNDFLNMLIELKNKGSIDGEISKEVKKLSIGECIAQAFVFFLGGADTSSTVVAYALTELGHHPEIQDKLRKEIQEKIKSSNGEITYDNLHEMTYLNKIINGKNWIFVTSL